jgi:hypothetical protein
MAKLDKEFFWFIENQDELVKKYNGRQLVIIGEEVVDDYETFEDAYFRSVEKYELGTFLIQECIPGEEAYTTTIYSRMGFCIK